MGTYLSTPVLEKGQETGETLDCDTTPLSWAVVDMQGWRKTMEDAHVASTDIAINGTSTISSSTTTTSSLATAKIFGVFDGHGGPEVARFCQLYLVDVWVKQMQQLLTTNITTTNATTTGTGTDAATDTAKPPHIMQEETPEQQRPNPADTPVGQALIRTFHALDRMIDDMNRRDELIALRSTKPEYTERRTTDSIPIPPVAEDPSPSRIVDLSDTVPSKTKDSEALATTTATTTTNSSPVDHMDDENTNGAATNTATDTIDLATATETADADNNNNDDDDSNEQVVSDETAQIDQDLLTEEENGEDDDFDDDDDFDGGPMPPIVSLVMQQILTVEAASGQVAIHVVTDSAPPTEATIQPAAPVVEPQKITASITQNGRQICNLPDHPIHAGCTAIVAVLVDRTLTVANAGDSRAVLCRGNTGGGGLTTEALSVDHKPQQERELTRITNAGGFVNQFGRVNGNLNLSRSIGDLKYKQVPGIPPAKQMITAEPDIVQVELQNTDEFLVLGCDGIWDCLTNEQAVKYVADRIDTKTPVEIGIEMLDEIISQDPRATQGIGGDNMTVMVIDLQPQSRSYR